ncbi:hypothetical protein [Naasia sp. SYSU D00057]|uniref:hypothetical protein n=1 Tax=Naasia sp. SYSU D00057 TaxID=2817380 RepID=UPI001B3187F9|nr:hypothetical protein [Naasia sp. SYSU D00057]
MLSAALSWFPHLQQAEEARLAVELERRRVALERAPRSPGVPESLRRSLPGRASTSRRPTAPEAAVCCPA